MRAGRRIASAVVAGGALAAAWACELAEVEVAKPDDVVVAEVMVVLASGSGGGPGFAMSASALLHRTRQGTAVAPVDGASVRLANQDGRAVVLAPEPRGHPCLTRWAYASDTLAWRLVRDETGASCYVFAETEASFAPGDQLALEVVLAGGGALDGASRIPSAFSMPQLRLEDGMCAMRPETQQRVEWTEADGAWAYRSEARITGHEPGDGFGVQSDSVDLQLLAIGGAQTGLVFPRSFGLSEYLDATYDRDLILKLRDGLPDGAWARLSVTAIDRNWMNWSRNTGVTFSGIVRIPSVFGDGTGVFATGVRREFEVTVRDDAGMPPCGPEEASPGLP